MIVCIYLYIERVILSKRCVEKVGQNQRALHMNGARLRVGSDILGHRFFHSFCQSGWRETQECAYVAPGSGFLHSFMAYENSLFSHQNNAYFLFK